MTDCPDAEKAALAEALEFWSKWFIVPVGQRKGRFKIIADKTDALLADLSPAAKEILEKAQAHDAMKAALRIIEERTVHLPGWAATDSAADVFLSELWAVAHKALAGKEPE